MQEAANIVWIEERVGKIHGGKYDGILVQYQEKDRSREISLLTELKGWCVLVSTETPSKQFVNSREIPEPLTMEELKAAAEKWLSS